MAKSKIKILTELEAAKVSLVKRGANRKPRFPITKSKETTMDGMEEILKALLEAEAEGEDKIKEVFKSLSDEGVAAMTGALRLVNAYKDELPKDAGEKFAELAGYEIAKAKGENPFATDDKEKLKAEKAKAKAEMEAKIAAEVKARMRKDARAAKAKEKGKDMPFGKTVAKALEGMPEDMREHMEPILKSMEEDRAEAVAKADEDTKKANEAREEIAKTLETERSDRQTKEWIAKAETDLSHFPGESSEDLGKMLKSLHDHDPKMAETQFTAMKAASEAVKKSALLQQAGVPGGLAAGSAEEKFEKMAQNLIMKGDGTVTIEKARVIVQEQNPDLYNEYLLENPSQTGERR